MMQLSARIETFPLRRSFAIARGTKTEARVLLVMLTQDGCTGRGEAVPYARYGESAETALAQVRGLPPELGHEDLPRHLPPGAARNAVDCAFWDLRAKQAGLRVHDLAGLGAPGPLTTAYTLSLDSPDTMYAEAKRHADRPLLKVKLGRDGDIDRVAAVRAAAPRATLIADANEGWTAESYARSVADLARLGVALIEQPLPAGRDGALGSLPRPIPLCADESCHTRASLPALRGLYDAVNVKLDKTGGLTEALALRDEARAMGFRIMAGCMVASSLSMAPALLVAQGGDFCDLDGPLLLARDRVPGLRYEGSVVHPAEPALWG